MKNNEELNEALRQAQVAGEAVAPDQDCGPESEVQSADTAPAEQPPAAFGEMVAEAAKQLGLSDAIASVVEEVLAPLEHGRLSRNVVKLIAQAIGRDEDLKNAEAAGYLRGRNEKIELMNRTAEPPEAEVKPAAFPRYTRRSFWDGL